MVNLIRMETYRFRKSIASLVILLSATLFMVLVFYLMLASTNTTDELSVASNTIMNYYQYMIQGDVLALFIVIFGVVFFSSENSSGFIKNTYGKESKKYKFLLSKLAVITLFTLILFAIAFMICIVGQQISNHAIVFGSNWGGFIRFIAIQFVLEIGFGAIVICLVSLVKNNIATTIVGIIYVMYGDAIYSLLDEKIQKLFHLSNFKLSNYVVFGNLYSINMNSSAKSCLRAFIVALFIGILSIEVSNIVLKKSDIQ